MAVNAGEYCGFDIAIEDPGILVVTFNRPESLNASTAAMKRDLVAVSYTHLTLPTSDLV